MTPATPGLSGLIRRAARAVTVAATFTGVVAITVTLAVGRVPDATVPSGTDTSPAGSPVGAPFPAYRLVGTVTGHPWNGHPGRWIKPYVVRPGDTATGLAVRFHAWTAELLAVNHLTRHSTLYVGRRLRIPVVLAALRKSRSHHRAHHRKRPAHSSWAGGSPAPPAAVRRAVVAAALRHHVGANLALAVAWQESGWQQRRISTAHAIGVMQVLPSTGRWVSSVLGRHLDLYRLHDNVTAGVYLLHLLHSGAPRHALAGYYQGFGSVHAHGLYPSTRHYIASVIALRDRLRSGWDPAEAGRLR